MDTTTAIVSTLGLVNSAIDAAKKAVGIAKDLDSLELKGQVGEVLNAVLDLKVRLLDIDEENRSLKAKLEASEHIKFDPASGLFFKKGETIPLCPKCFQGTEHLQVYISPKKSNNVSYHFCNVCRTSHYPPRS